MHNYRPRQQGKDTNDECQITVNLVYFDGTYNSGLRYSSNENGELSLTIRVAAYSEPLCASFEYQITNL